MRRGGELIELISRLVAVLIMVCMMLLVMLQVLFRYVLRFTIPWTEELARVFCIWLTFIGAAFVQASGSHIRTSYFLDRFSFKIRQAFRVGINLVSSGFLLAAIWGSIKMMREAWVISMSSMPWLSTGYLYLALIVGLSITLIFLLREVVEVGSQNPEGGHNIE